jgi:hypothetical protein
MGEPNATATPAALAAVTISRILPDSRVNTRNPQDLYTHLDFWKSD